jgi:CRISPR-associated endonuclease/helicase Cas3
MRRAYRIPFDYLPKRDEGFDASPGALRTLRQSAENEPTLKKLIDEATTPAPLRPALTRALVDAWSMTSLETHTGRPAIDPWLRGWVEDDGPQTTVVWRTYLPARSGPREPRERELKAFFEAAPPHTSEILETETFRVLEWLDARAKAVRQLAQRRQDKVEGSLPPGLDDVVAFVLSRAGDLRGTFRLRDLAKSEDAKADKERKERLHTALDGATLVLDARLAGLRKDGLLDRSEDAVPRTADDGNEWLAKHALPFRVRRMSADGTDLTVADGGWRERLRFAVDVSEEGEVQRWLIVEKWRHDAATEEDRSSARPQLLDDHQSWAELRARALAQRLGLAGRYLEMLAIAARIHDEGKRAQQWQVAFRAPANGPYAKTRGPINYTLLDGYRHELGSLLLAESDDRLSHLPDDLRDLALHLIAAHHGFARPVIGITGCDNAPPSALERPAGDVALRFARLQRRWGPWGLAWWEALLRAVDQQASRDNDAQDIDIAEPAARTEGV